VEFDGSKAWVRALCGAVMLFVGASAAQAQICRDRDVAGAAYTVCTVEARTENLRLYARDGTGRPYGSFAQLAAALAQTKRTLVFAMNAGMFEEDLAPVGLYIEGGAVRHAANTRDGPGNFHMKPNGIFYFGPDGAGVMETTRFLAANLHPDFATQSGPMLVIDGAIHPKLQPDGTSLKIRNGVGVRGTHTIVFAISRSRSASTGSRPCSATISAATMRSFSTAPFRAFMHPNSGVRRSSCRLGRWSA